MGKSILRFNKTKYGKPANQTDAFDYKYLIANHETLCNNWVNLACRLGLFSLSYFPCWYVLNKSLTNKQLVVEINLTPTWWRQSSMIIYCFLSDSCLIFLNKIKLFFIDIEQVQRLDDYYNDTIKLMENVLLIFKVTEKPRVSFGPIVEKMCRSLTGRAKHKENTRQMRLQAKGHFTPNPSQKRTPTSIFNALFMLS